MQKASKRIKVLTPYILIIILFACCYQLVVWREVLRKKRVLVDKLEKEVSITKSLLQDAYTIQTCNWLLGSDSVRNIRLVNHKKETVFLHDLLRENTLIFYFDSEMCNLCIEKEFQNLEKLANSYGKDNIILISSGFRSVYIFRDKKYTAWKEQMYLCKSNLYSEKNLSNTPSLTLVNAKGAIFAAHHATKSNNQHFELFFNFLRRRQIDVTSATFGRPKTQ